MQRLYTYGEGYVKGLHMLRITNPEDSPLDGALESGGGFAWWYADLVDDEGNGLVLIPAWGLPFLPGYASSARRGAPQTAGSRPSVAISVYERGQCAYYALLELESHEASRDGHVLRFGESVFAFANGRLEATFDMDAPGGRLTGTVRVDGVPRAAVNGSPMTHDTHEWCPMTGPAHGSWSLRAGERRFEGSGSGYLDRNAGLADLESLGIARWHWARTVLPDRLRIAYVLYNLEGRCEAALVEVFEDGRTEAHPAEVQEAPNRRNLWGLPWCPILQLTAGNRTMAIRVDHRPDDGPFYQRTICTVETELGTAMGIGETCVSERVDVGWQRPLVSMCVHHTNGANSMWLPLFTGPREGRFARLLGVA